MRRFAFTTALMLAAGLAGCGKGGGAASGGAQAPAAVQGTWGADCAEPFVKFDGANMTVFADKTTYPLQSATLAGGQLTVGYTTPQGAISEVYVQDGQTLRLDHGVYGGSEATWHKQPMNKCS
jgi:hypothetical protein